MHPFTSVRAWPVIGLLATLAMPSHAAVYDCVALLAKGSEPRSLAWAMNNKGHVAGQATFKGAAGGAAALWKQPDRPPRNLTAAIDGAIWASQAWGLNDQGEVVGNVDRICEDCDGGQKPYLWRAGVPSELPLLPGTHRSGSAQSVNNKGRIVGYNYIDGVFHAVLWRDGQAINLPSLGSLAGQAQTDSTAHFINENNVVVGTSRRTPDSLDDIAVRWDAKGRITELAGGSSAVGINRAGTIVGQGGNHAVAWQNDQLIRLVQDADASASIARDINESGTIVGGASMNGRGQVAMVWPDVHEPPLDLNTLVPNGCGLSVWFQLESASDILDSGQILVNGYQEPNLSTTFVLTPR